MDQINPFIREAWDSVLDRSIPERALFDYELLYIKSGACTIMVRDQEYIAQPGDFFLFRPRVPHSIQVPEGVCIGKVYIHFDVQYFDNAAEIPVNFTTEDHVPEAQKGFFRPDVLAENFPGIADRFHPADSLVLEQLLSKVIYYHAQKDNILSQIEEKQAFLNLLTQILYELQLASVHTPKKEKLSALPIKMYLDNHLSENISLDVISRECGISKYHLISIFREAYGITPHRYHQGQRIKQAQYLLRFTNLNVSEVSNSLGFDTLA
ncbi:MAG: helix-turn-helix transcriptional regulator, partial [Clostridia bacterium]|nr:helix-turn-helix transcriptional regulator [Clostridia bacterium]